MSFREPLNCSINRTQTKKGNSRQNAIGCPNRSDVSPLLVKFVKAIEKIINYMHREYQLVVLICSPPLGEVSDVFWLRFCGCKSSDLHDSIVTPVIYWKRMIPSLLQRIRPARRSLKLRLCGRKSSDLRDNVGTPPIKRERMITSYLMSTTKRSSQHNKIRVIIIV